MGRYLTTRDDGLTLPPGMAALQEPKRDGGVTLSSVMAMEERTARDADIRLENLGIGN